MEREGIMPKNSPLYVRTPHHYKDIYWYSVVCRIKRYVLEKYVQDPLTLPEKDILDFEVFIADYKSSEIGGYHESGIIVPANYKNVEGSHFSNLYLDSDAGIAAGREIIGFPKKYANVYLYERSDTITGTVVRKNSPIISLYANFKEPTKVSRLPVAPRLQVRYIPRVDGPGSEINQVIATRWPPEKGKETVQIHETKTGSGRVIFGTNGEEDFTELNDAEVLGAVKMVLDFTLEYATILDTIK